MNGFKPDPKSLAMQTKTFRIVFTNSSAMILSSFLTRDTLKFRGKGIHFSLRLQEIAHNIGHVVNSQPGAQRSVLGKQSGLRVWSFKTLTLHSQCQIHGWASKADSFSQSGFVRGFDRELAPPSSTSTSWSVSPPSCCNSWPYRARLSGPWMPNSKLIGSPSPIVASMMLSSLSFSKLPSVWVSIQDSLRSFSYLSLLAKWNRFER